MAQEFRLADPGEGIHEAEIIEVHVSEGDEVSDGDTVLTVETDKASVEIPAPFNGVIEELRVKQGEIAEVGDVLMTYRGEGAEEAEEAEEKREKKREGRAAKGNGEDREERDKAERRERKEREKEGRKTESRRSGDRPVPAAPATRRLARELGVALEDVEPSGAHGRVKAEDVRAAAGEEGGGKRVQGKPKERREKQPEAGGEAAPASRLTPAVEPARLPDFGRWGETERQPLRSVRRATALRMARAWAEIPHVMHRDSADITELERFRREHAGKVEAEGGKLSLTVLAIKATVAALKQHPRFNASLDAETEEIVLKRYYNIGVAIDTEAGLYVPVVRNADRKSLAELSAELVELAERARDGKLRSADMQGGSFTITNPGPLGGEAFMPIINYPQAAILGLAQARLEPVVEGDLNDAEVTPRLRLPLCVSFDHRINDGADAARFTRTLAETLSDVDAMILHM